MQVTAIAVSQNTHQLSQSSTPQDRHRRGLVALLLLCGAVLITGHPVYASPDDEATTPGVAETSETSDGGLDEDDDELDGNDDGSRALIGKAQAVDIKRLQPVSADEEQVLLGDWGDSENED